MPAPPAAAASGCAGTADGPVDPIKVEEEGTGEEADAPLGAGDDAEDEETAPEAAAPGAVCG